MEPDSVDNLSNILALVDIVSNLISIFTIAFAPIAFFSGLVGLIMRKKWALKTLLVSGVSLLLAWFLPYVMMVLVVVAFPALLVLRLFQRDR